MDDGVGMPIWRPSLLQVQVVKRDMTLSYNAFRNFDA